MNRVVVAGRVYKQAQHTIPVWEELWEETQAIHGGGTEEDEAAYLKIYEETLEMLRGFSNQDVWRSMSIPETVDPTTLANLGIYWADSEYGVDSVWLDHYDDYWKGGKGREVVYHARVEDLGSVDTYGTVEARVFGGNAVDSEEVRLFDGVPIFVHDVTLEDNTVVPINDWRTT